MCSRCRGPLYGGIDPEDPPERWERASLEDVETALKRRAESQTDWKEDQ